MTGQVQRRTALVAAVGLVVTLAVGPWPLEGQATPPVPQDASQGEEASSDPASGPGTAVPPAEVPSRITLPEGFRVTLYAGEPDVVQPIAFAFDPRGRLWVAENHSYPEWLPQGAPGRDRILIFEDSDGDGQFDRRTVFLDSIANISGLELGFGGVWVTAIPNLLFIPDADGDDTPDGPPEIVLDGWSMEAQHNVVNGLIWGPDGWLYGMHGILATSMVGRPGTPEAQRTPINCGVWRYHPTRGTFEVVAHGTTNPWGLDFDAYGEAFITNCVIPHLYHVVPGAHYERMYGQDFNPHLYELMPTCADHIHWAGGRWQDSRGGVGAHGAAGGGHAHVGAMIYQGDNWPEPYRGSVYTCNLHGRRVNRDILEPKGSGYVARHAPDFLLVDDPWFRGLQLKSGPDGGVYLTDWSDTGECHETDADGAHRENGRIYKITFGEVEPRPVDLASLDDAALAALQQHPNDWHARVARRLLQERAAGGRTLPEAAGALRSIFREAVDVTHTLRALWASHAIGALNTDDLFTVLDHPSEHVRAWGIRLLGDEGAFPPESVERFASMAANDPSPKVRLSLASALQKIPPADRWAIADGLVGHAEDADDHALSLMIWYGIEPAVVADPSRAVALAGRSAIPLLRRFAARRLVAADPARGLAALVSMLRGSGDPAVLRDLLSGADEALRGRRSVPMPEGWSGVFPRLAGDSDPAVHRPAILLALRFGDPEADATLRRIVAKQDGPEERRWALEALIGHRARDLGPTLLHLLDDPDVRGVAIRGLAAHDDPAIPRDLIDRYARLTPSERADAVATLATRPDFAIALLDAVERGVIPRTDLSAAIARQLRALDDPRISPRLDEVWGTLRDTSAEKARIIADYTARFTPESLASADRSRGRAVFERTCARCHRFFDSGGDVGPELTGSDRANLSYILENVIDPSAVVGREYTMSTIATVDGRLISGIVQEQDDAALVVRTENERLVIPREDIEEMAASTISMMPEGIFEGLTDTEIGDLMTYLASSEQVPLPADFAAGAEGPTTEGSGASAGPR